MKRYGTMKFKQTYSFDDLLLVPAKSDIESRDEVSLSSKIADCEFSIPIIASPMDTVTESDMMYAMAKLGGLGVLHRYNPPVKQASIFADTRMRLEEENHSYSSKLSVAIGSTDDFEKRAKLLVENGVRILCLDVAHGHHCLTERAIKTLKDSHGEQVIIMAGNIATPEAYHDLSTWGADAVRIGIGGGSICSTRIQTGHGMPTLQSVMDCASMDGAAIIADGGIKTAGDIVKALAAGADFVMLGSMLAGTDESPGDVISSNEDMKYKVYRGMASVEAQVDWRGKARSLEGISTTIPYKGSVIDIVRNLESNIKSGFSYSGARSITELQAKANFIQQSSAGQLESSTHILKR
jgi:IMP dehydrogenase